MIAAPGGVEVADPPSSSPERLVRDFAEDSEPMPTDLILRTFHDGVTTLTMNNPRRLNGWTLDMLDALREAMSAAAADPATKAVILTGTDPYYSAGVNLGSTVALMHPKKLRAMIIEHNERLFRSFLDFPKPILAAVNGPAIGACVTSAVLCDAILASERATFSTPFARLAVPPEGCSSVLFPDLLGRETAARILGEEGWVPSAAEALEIGLVERVVPHGQLLEEAQELAERWIAEGRRRTLRGATTHEGLIAVNQRESVQVAEAFLARPFLVGQAKALWNKKKRRTALFFATLWATQPLWSRIP